MYSTVFFDLVLKKCDIIREESKDGEDFINEEKEKSKNCFNGFKYKLKDFNEIYLVDCIKRRTNDAISFKLSNEPVSDNELKHEEEVKNNEPVNQIKLEKKPSNHEKRNSRPIGLVGKNSFAKTEDNSDIVVEFNKPSSNNSKEKKIETTKDIKKILE